ncbi:MAG: hypothetical protein ACRCXZ_06335 [Patescibacteria group bacterium]
MTNLTARRFASFAMILTALGSGIAPAFAFSGINVENGDFCSLNGVALDQYTELGERNSDVFLSGYFQVIECNSDYLRVRSQNGQEFSVVAGGDIVIPQ